MFVKVHYGFRIRFLLCSGFCILCVVFVLVLMLFLSLEVWFWGLGFAGCGNFVLAGL